MICLKDEWNFKDVKDNIEAIKSQYQGVLLSFLWNETKEKLQETRKIKQQVFTYNNIQYWQRERLWEVLNDDLEIEKFRRLK